MHDFYIFDEKELVRIGIVCPSCETESVFNLIKDHTAICDRVCPGCGENDFLKGFMTEAKQSYNWVTYYKRGVDMKKKPRIRLYFKRENGQ